VKGGQQCSNNEGVFHAKGAKQAKMRKMFFRIPVPLFRAFRMEKAGGHIAMTQLRYYTANGDKLVIFLTGLTGLTGFSG